MLCFLLSCFPKKHTNEIVFSCIYCTGCVQNAFNEISELGLDSIYKIIIDTTCYSHLINDYNFKFDYLPMDSIEIRYGRIGNFIAINKTGNVTKFLTTMTLKSDFINKQ